MRSTPHGISPLVNGLPLAPADARSVVELVRMRALHQPDRLAYAFLADGEREEGRLTYGELDARARATAVLLREAGGEGERALLLYPPGLEYVVAFLGCLYAGVVAVPVYPPRPNRPNPRLQGIVADARPALALATAEIAAEGPRLAVHLPELAGVRWVAAGGEAERANEWTPVEVDGGTLAFLQYTSGSTSAPKGVMVSHGNLLHNFAVIEHFCGYSEESRSVMWLPPYHDMGLIGGILQPLFSGYPVWLMPPMAFLQRPVRWLEAISRYRATTSGGPNFAYELCLQKVTAEERAALDLRAWTLAFNGAEPVRAATLERFARGFAECGFRPEAFFPCYGLAEGTLMATGSAARAQPRVMHVAADALERGRVRAEGGAGAGVRTLVGCGRSAPGQLLRIVDPDTRRACAPGEVGEVWIAGPSVAGGYWERPAETEEAFGAMVAGSGAGPFLRTGDLGFLDDGELYVTGRSKDLIIVRGRNLYPHDLEAVAERCHPALRPGNAAAFSVDEGGEERVVLLLEVRRESVGADVDAVAAAVRAAVAAEEGVHLHAVGLVRPGGILKTSSGKVQRRACRAALLASELPLLGMSTAPEPAPGGEMDDEGAIAARLRAAGAERGALLETYLRRCVAAMLGANADELSPTAALVSHGLDSLRATQLRERVERELGVRLPVTALLEDGGTAGLAARLLEELTLPAPAAADPAPAGGPLSFAQEALWFLDRLHPGTAAYNVAVELRLDGALDTGALLRGVSAAVRRQGALRTVFPADGGEPAQVVLPFAEPAVPLSDLRSLADPAGEAARRAGAEARLPFDLAAGPLVRFRLLRVADDEHRLVMVMHHIVSDGWSVGVLVRELAAGYRAFAAGGEPSLPPLEAGFAEHAARGRAALTPAVVAPLLDHWRERLAGAPALELHPSLRHGGGGGTEGALHRFELSAERAGRLRKLARAEGVTPFVALLAGFAVLLARHSGEDDVVVGTPVADRGAPGTAELVGYFVNPLPLRADLGGDPPFRELVARLRRTVLDALGHAALPFERLVEELHPARDPERNPVFETMFVLQGVPLEAVRLPGLTITPELLDTGAAKLDLTLQMGAREDGGYWAVFEYATARFTGGTVAGLAERFVTLLDAAVADPAARIHSLSAFAPGERAEILEGALGPADGGRDELLHDAFLAQAARTPHATALVHGGVEVTYAERAARSAGVAGRLLALGVGPEAVVGVCMERGPRLVAALLGVLRAGGAYLPLDPGYPAERLALMVEDSGARFVLAEPATAGVVPPSGARVVLDDGADGGAEAGGPRAVPENLAYLIYTSGSTGRPKAVAIEHRSAAARIRWALREFSGEELAGVLASTSVCFDLSVFEIFAPLAAGGAVVLAADALALPTLPARGRVTLLNTVPSAARELLAAGAVPRSVRVVNLAGEPLPRDLAEGLLGTGHVRRVLNLYGPSEDTTYSTLGRARAGAAGAPPIGNPLPGTRGYVADRSGGLVPREVPGELLLGGRGLARGYLGRPALTAEKFVPDPFSGEPGARLYRTGDRVRRDGELEFLGRLDQQLKIRGFRVEPGEVEAALALHPSVDGCAVVARHGALVAYVAGGGAPGEAELRQWLRARLPEALVPSRIVGLAALPRTPNGKLDRAALPEPGAAVGGAVYVAPGSEAEAAIAGVWAELLEVERVGVHDDFFALGGHSLLAARAAVRIQAALGVEVPIRVLFDAPTVAGLAVRLTGSAPAAPAVLVRVPRDGPLPLSFAQERMWLLDQMEPGSPAYNMAGALRMRGVLDAEALERALGEVVARHEALRTHFPARGGEPRQAVTALAFALARADLRGASLMDAAAAEAARPFDLAHGPLFRATLLRAGDAEWVLLVTLHHAVADGRSVELLLAEVAALYPAFAGGLPSPLPPLPFQYADWAAWQRAHRSGDALEPQLGFWRERLAGLPPLLALPTDHPRPALAGTAQGRHAFELPAATGRGLRALARAEGATPFMVLAAGFAALLGRYAGSDDVALGTPEEGRVLPETEGMIGVFVNTLVLRAGLAGHPSARTLLRRMRETVLEARAHAELPFERLVAEVGVERSLAHTPLFQSMLTLNPAAALRLRLPGMEAEVEETGSGAAKFDLSLAMVEDGDALRGVLWYRADLFEPATAARMVEHLASLLAGFVELPDTPVDELPLAPDAGRERPGDAWNGAEWPRGRCAHELFVERAVLAPGGVAVEHPGGTVTFGELERRTRRLARRLRELGVGAEVPVGIFLERGPDSLAAVLAVLRAGGAFVPLDPALPHARLRYLLRDSGARVVVTCAELARRLPRGSVAVGVEEEGDEGPLPAVHPEGAAYVLYTSGSTGEPKGVMVEHRSLAGYLAWAAGTLLPEGAPLPAVSALAFDASLKQLLAPLVAGRSVWFPGDVGGRPAALLEALAGKERAALNCVPSVWDAALEAMERGEGPRPAGLVRLLLGGEAPDAALLPRTRAHFPGIELWNLYGPTEATANATAALLRPDEPVHIGTPVAGARGYVLDAGLRELPVGIPGELCVGGPGVARGYLGQPGRTAERFVPDPCSGVPGARMYRTGDRVRRRAGGELEHLGRLDRQLKVRGLRVEPGEVEAALRTHAGVRDAAVVALADGRGGTVLVAYLEGDGAPPAELREHLRARIAEGLIPSLFVAMEALPRTPGGKVSPSALPAPEWGVGETVAPRTPAEAAICAMWSDLLGVERVGVEDDFFALGGHSLVGARLVARIRDAFGVELPLRALFQARTVARLAERVAEADAAVPGGAVGPAASGAALPLSFAQERFWFLDRLDPGSAAYHMPAALHLHGPLDVGALRRAVHGVVTRHEVLRTSYPATAAGEPARVVAHAGTLPVPRVELSALSEADRGRQVGRLARDAARRPFDLARGPVLRATVLRLSAAHSVLLFNLHHVAGDGASMGILVREVSEGYRAAVEGRTPSLPPLPVQYADFAAWQRRTLAGAALDAKLEFWRTRLAGAPAALELPTDRPRAAAGAPRGAVLPVEPAPATVGALRRLACGEGVTPFAVLLAAWQAVLAQWSGEDDVVVGTPLAGRGHSELEGVIGCFVNLLPVRTGLGDDPTVRELLKRVSGAVLEAHAHQDLPFERLVDELAVERSLHRTPLVQVVLSLDGARPALDLGPVRGQVEESFTGAAKFDLVLRLTDHGSALRGVVEYRADLWDPATIERMLERLERTIVAMSQGPELRLSALELMDEAERDEALFAWNPPAEPPPAPEGTLAGHFAAWAARTPHAVALSCDGGALTYAELDERAHRLARRLAREGVEPEVRVALLLERGPGLVVALLAVLRAGGAYVPIDPAWPAERVDFVLRDSGARLLLTEESLAGRTDGSPVPVLLVGEGEENGPPLPPRGGPDALAYVIYTSGSTGRPKGVGVTHANVLRLFSATAPWFGFGEDDVWTLFHSAAFDFSVWEIWGALLHGGRLVVVPWATSRDPAAFRALLAREGVTVLNQTPSAFAPLMAADAEAEAGLALRWVVFGGEALEPAALAPWVERHGDRAPRLVNMYGITETTVHVTFRAITRGEVEGGSGSVIGAPIPDLRLYLLAPGGGPVPAGVAGEMYVGGAGVARGYLGRPGLTAERFVPDPYSGVPGARLYRSGDRARRRAGGELEYMGRLDQQVKVRGFRIEPGEIEAVLRGHPAVSGAAVVLRDYGSGDRRLVAYLVAGNDGGPDAAELRRWAGERLPEYMVPAAMVLLARLPLTTSGKLDQRALPEPEPGGAPASGEPRTPAERTLARVWAEVLRRDGVGREDNFFELGGDSILSIQVVTRARAAGVRVTPRQLFERPTVAGLAEVATLAADDEGGSAPAAGPARLAPIQHWFFEQELACPAHWNQGVLLVPREPLDPERLGRALDALLEHHDALRLRFARGGEGWSQEYGASGERVPLEVRTVPAGGLQAALAEVHAGMDLSAGPLFRAGLFRLAGGGERLLLAAHHLVVDGVSWRVLLEDLQTVYEQLGSGGAPALPPRTTSYGRWTERLAEHAGSGALERELAGWTDEELPPAPAQDPASVARARTVEGVLDATDTDALLRDLPAVYRTRVDDALLAALARAFVAVTGESRLRVTLEGHGRDCGLEGVDLSRTVGWFTSLYPVLLDGGTLDPGGALRSVKERLRGVPGRGAGFGSLRYLRREPALADVRSPQVSFNYLGQVDNSFADEALFALAPEPAGPAQAPENGRAHALDVVAVVEGGRLRVRWTYAPHLQGTVERLSARYLDELRALVAHCQAPGSGGFTPSDFPAARVSQADLDTLARLLGGAPAGDS